MSKDKHEQFEQNLKYILDELNEKFIDYFGGSGYATLSIYMDTEQYYTATIQDGQHIHRVIRLSNSEEV